MISLDELLKKRLQMMHGKDSGRERTIEQTMRV